MTQTIAPPNAQESAWLQHVPVPLFAMVMGVAGLGLAWRKAHETLAMPQVVGEVLLVLAALLFVLVLGLYGAKALKHRPAMLDEFNHPIRQNFFPTISISLLLLALAAYPYSAAVAEGMWIVGAALHLVFTLRVIGRWIVHKHDIAHLNPAWFIPVVGNIIVPVLGVRLGHVEVSWFFFSIGAVFWLLLFTIVLYRVIFHEHDLPPRLIPTLFILLAPPAVGFLAYLALNGGQLDGFARVLVSVAVFLFLVLASIGKRFLALPFAVSWWAYTFPLDALSLAVLQYGHLKPHGLVAGFATGLLLVTSAVVALVLVRTTKAAATGHLFVPE